MKIYTSTTKFDFKAQLDRAATHGVLCARFEWYSAPRTDALGGFSLLGSDLFLDQRIFEKLEQTFRFGDHPRPDIEPLDHVLIYLFDGRDGTPKIHANLWKPSMGRNLVHQEYFSADDPDPYLPYVMNALARQSAAVKVSTVVAQAFAKVRQAKGSGLLPDVPLEAHKQPLRASLMRLRHTDPLICFHPSKRTDQPHFNRTSLVEHLCIYDRNPTWNLLDFCMSCLRSKSA